MEKRYTAKVPASLAKRLYEAGMPLKVTTEMEPDPYTGKVKKIVNVEPPSYAKTLDWLASKNIIIHVYSFPCWRGEYVTTKFNIIIYSEKTHNVNPSPTYDYFSWHEAADYGIEKALEMLTDNETKED